MKSLNTYLTEKLIINKNFTSVSADAILDDIWNSKKYDKSTKVNLDLMKTDAAHWLPVTLWNWIVGNLGWKDKNAIDKILDILENIIVNKYNSKCDVKGYMQGKHSDEILNNLHEKITKYETSYSILYFYIGDDYSYIKYNRDNTNPNEDIDLIIKKL